MPQKAGVFIVKSGFGISNIPAYKQKRSTIILASNNRRRIISQFAQIKVLLLTFQ